MLSIIHQYLLERYRIMAAPPMDLPHRQILLTPNSSLINRQMEFMSSASNHPSVRYLPDEKPLAQKSKVIKAVCESVMLSSK